MLLRSSSTPFLHHHHHHAFLSSYSPSSLHLLRRAFSDGHLPSLSLHQSSSTPNDDAGPGRLHTELSFSIYNTFGKGGGEVDVVAAPLASPAPPLISSQQEQEQEQEEGPATVVQPDHPEVPLFLARGLGIDRIASGFFTAGKTAETGRGGRGTTAGKTEGVDEQQQQQQQQHDEAVAALDAQYKTMVDEQPGNALFLRNYAQFLHEVKGDPRRAEEYYSRAMLADPSDGEIMSQYAKLVWEVHHDPERCLGYFQKSVKAAPHNSHVLAAYASFLWEQDDDDDDQGTERAAAAGTGQAMELASAAV